MEGGGEWDAAVYFSYLPVVYGLYLLRYCPFFFFTQLYVFTSPRAGHVSLISHPLHPFTPYSQCYVTAPGWIGEARRRYSGNTSISPHLNCDPVKKTHFRASKPKESTSVLNISDVNLRPTSKHVAYNTLIIFE